uniref:Homeobox domain-containing protein n=1 Tax=Aegilops tauschii subsp. strangulata TaxID=200361 RepID=A0A453IM92_AEGTS
MARPLVARVRQPHAEKSGPSFLAVESIERQHQAATRLSSSPPHPAVLPSPPLSHNSAAAAANARWTPTKEQIGMLEGLYRQGLRTPTAEQIQQVTARLQKHVPIEGKNVF